jgi:choline-sulfatase
VTLEQVRRARAAYWALVERLDGMVGELLRVLEETGLAGDTVVVYTSDHGDSLGEHGLWWKQNFHEEAVTAPCIVRWPGVIPGGMRVENVVSGLDLTATILAIAGAPALPGGHGRDLLQLLDGDGADRWQDVAFSEMCFDPRRATASATGYSWPQRYLRDGVLQRMVRRGDWKLIHYHGDRPQLFNLREDPGELSDRAQDPSLSGVVAELTASVLDGWDPERIRHEVLELGTGRRQLLSDWAELTQPEERLRWTLRSSHNRLD